MDSLCAWFLGWAKHGEAATPLHVGRRVERYEGDGKSERRGFEQQDAGEKRGPQALRKPSRNEFDHRHRDRHSEAREEGQRKGVVDIRPARRLPAAKETDPKYFDEPVDGDRACEEHA
jgi:hypothetical protein